MFSIRTVLSSVCSVGLPILFQSLAIIEGNSGIRYLKSMLFHNKYFSSVFSLNLDV